MRWKIQALRKSGDTRIITKFLLMPRTDGKEVRWLEYVTMEEKFHPGGYYENPYWECVRFIDDTNEESK